MSTILDHEINTLPVSMEFVADKDTNVIVVPFAFTETIDDIHLEVNAIDSEGTYKYKLQANNELLVEPSIPKGSTVYIYRETDVDESLYVLNDGAVFTASNIDNNFKQIRMSQQELIGRFRTLKKRVDKTLSDAGDVLNDAKEATNKAKEVVDDVNQAIWGKINDGVVGTWANRSQRDKNKELISLEDFGASPNASAEINNDALYRLEQSYRDRVIDLRGNTYKVYGDFTANKYINGTLYADAKKVYGKGYNTVSNYEYSLDNGTPYGKFVAIHPEGDSGVTTAPHTALQGFAFDPTTNTMYGHTTYKGNGAEQTARIVKFSNLGGYGSTINKTSETPPTLDIGHQSLGLTKHADGKMYFWSTVGATKYGSRALYVVRLTVDTNTMSIQESKFIQVFDAVNWVNDASRVMNVSPCGKWLVVFNARKDNGIWYCRVFRIVDLLQDTFDVSNSYLYEFPVTNQGLPVQSIAIDSKGIYILHGGGIYTNVKPYNYVYGVIEVRTLTGELQGLDNNLTLCRKTAKDINVEHKTTDYYEDEALGFVPTGFNTWCLGLMSITGRVNGHMYNALVLCTENSVTTTVGTKEKPALALTGNAKVTFPNYGDGLEFQVQYASKNAETVASLSNVGTFKHSIHELRRDGTPYTRTVNLKASDDVVPKTAINLYNLQPAVTSTSGADVLGGATQFWQDTSGGFYSRLMVYNKKREVTSLFIDGTNKAIKIQGGDLVPNGRERVGTPDYPFSKSYLGNLNINALAVCSSNSDAKAQGLVVGDIYRNSGGQLFVVI